MNIIKPITIHVDHIESNDKNILEELSINTFHRQNHTDFMRFLKETPSSQEELLKHFQKKVEEVNTKIFVIRMENLQEIIGSLILHNFIEDQKIIEISSRIKPDMQSRGVGTTAAKQVIDILFKNDDVKIIESRHSAFNK